MDTEQATVPYGYCHCGCGQQTTIVKVTAPSRGYAKGDPYRYLHGHAGRRPGPDYIVDEATGCWVWQKTFRKDGYPQVTADGESQPAYRVMYKRLVGPIPDGMHLDHLCRVRACVNPAHLEPVTAAENSRRALPHRGVKTHCAQGHEMTPDNTITTKKGHRRCRECKHLDNLRQGRRRWGGKRAAAREARAQSSA